MSILDNILIIDSMNKFNQDDISSVDYCGLVTATIEVINEYITFNSI